ncbi:MAG TPA: transaldolase [Gemmatimonadaceae bacterium]|nr:transaldolase [Gemmatimonadaceae bacterium]
MNRLQQLHDAGVALWLDFIERTMLHNGDLDRRIREDALTGMTSNPTIFEKALAEGQAYDAQLRDASEGLTAMQLFELVATTDVRDACDRFRVVYDRTKGDDGYVSIEVSPGAAHDAQATVEEARRLWKTVDRPNLLVKIPGTVEGALAVRKSIAEGINVNITLLFALEAHDRVIDAYMSGLEDRVTKAEPIDRIYSVASFFVSRVDGEVDKRLDAVAPGSRLPAPGSLKGKVAIANAKLAYQLFVERFSSPRWKALEAKGARVQKPLWASTSTKDPAYRDVMYVEQLIGPRSINTLPPQTIEAFRDHGEVRRTVDQNVDDARRTLAELERLGISMTSVTDKLLTDGLTSFQKSFDSLIAGLANKSKQLGRELATR